MTILGEVLSLLRYFALLLLLNLIIAFFAFAFGWNNISNPIYFIWAFFGFAMFFISLHRIGYFIGRVIAIIANR